MWVMVLCVLSIGGCYLLVYGVIRYYAPVPRLRRSVSAVLRQQHRLASVTIVEEWGRFAIRLLANEAAPELLTQIAQAVAVLQAYQDALRRGLTAQPAEQTQLTTLLTAALTQLQTFQQQQYDRAFHLFHEEAAEFAATLDVQ